MAETSYDMYRRLGPEFVADTDSTIDAWIDDATSEMKVSAWGSQYGRAAIYLALHLRKMADLSALAAGGGGLGLAGVVSSVKEDGVSLTFKATGGSSSGSSTSAYETTLYGKQYMRLRDKTIARITHVMPG